MPRLKLTFACGLYDRMRALHAREIEPEGIDLEFQVVDSPRSIFDRMAGGLEFDLSEMSASEFISRKAAGQCPFDDVFGEDFWSYGVEANRRTLETLVRYMAEQSLIAEAIPVQDLFVPV